MPRGRKTNKEMGLPDKKYHINFTVDAATDELLTDIARFNAVSKSQALTVLATFYAKRNTDYKKFKKALES